MIGSYLWVACRTANKKYRGDERNVTRGTRYTPVIPAVGAPLTFDNLIAHIQYVRNCLDWIAMYRFWPVAVTKQRQCSPGVPVMVLKTVYTLTSSTYVQTLWTHLSWVLICGKNSKNGYRTNLETIGGGGGGCYVRNSPLVEFRYGCVRGRETHVCKFGRGGGRFENDSTHEIDEPPPVYPPYCLRNNVILVVLFWSGDTRS